MLSELAAARVRIKELDSQILELERALFALRAEKALQQAQLDSYKYPVLTLPSELVSEILIHFLPTYPSRPPLRGHLSPTLLTQICSKWRQIALATPTLWRAMELSGTLDNVRDLPQIQVWFSRSGCCPLSIEIQTTYPRPDLSQVISALLTYRARWEHVDIEVSSMPETDGGQMPLLRHLCLSLVDSPTSSIVAFSDAPMLRTAVLNYRAAQNIMLPWAQLTSLTLNQMFPCEWEPILQQTTNLVYCTLDVPWDAEGEPGPDLDIRLPYLESFTLTVDHDMDGCLDSFILPALRRLEVPERFLDASPIRTLASFISKSRCQLQEAKITGEISVPRESYRQEFRSIPNFYFDCEDQEEDSGAEEIQSEANS
ncbi:hypothetical protein DFH06DRAFT_1472655 [Mycena polygramma]|nr:hypothetical protein DFH06DRAFT_1472655 [Mycena polygramma]